MYSDELMDFYYEEGSQEPEDTSTDDLITEANEFRHQIDELDHTFSYWRRHTVPWNQVVLESGHYVGCGNAAWAILFAYWKQFKGKSRLFDGANVYTTNYKARRIADAMIACSKYCDTRYPENDNQGFTWSLKMKNGIQYAKEKGYPDSSVNRIGGSEYEKFDKIYPQIQADKPVILLISTKGFGHAANHFVVIDGVDKVQSRRHSRGMWWNKDVKYLANWGHGTKKPPKWIYVRDWGKNQNKVYGSFYAYLVDIK